MSRMMILCFSLFLALPLSASKLPESSLYQLDSTWTNQKDQKVKLSDLAGSPRILVMLYTRCDTTCPLILEDIRSVLSELSDAQKKRVQISLFSFDSQDETAESLSQFAKQRKLDDKWQLHFGTEEDVSLLAAALGVRFKRLENNHYIHSNMLFFLDEKGEIQAQKDGLKSPKADFVSKVKSALK